MGAVTLATLIFFFRPQPRKSSFREPLHRRILELDLVGNFLIIGAIIMILLALQLGGVQLPWNSAQIVGLLVGGGLGLLIFGLWQKHRGLKALIPPKILQDRTIAASCISGFFLSGAFIVHSYYIPYWFQAIQADSAIAAGVHVVPYVAGLFLASVFAGLAVTKFGYFTAAAIFGPLISIVGCGLLTRLEPGTSLGVAIGYQIPAAVGIGIAFQQGLVAVQAVLDPELLPIGTALIIFAQSLSAAIFVSVGNSLLNNEFARGLAAATLPGVNIAAVLQSGVTEIRSIVPAEQLATVVGLFNQALSAVFILAVPLAGLAFLTALPMRWIDLTAARKGVGGAGMD